MDPASYEPDGIWMGPNGIKDTGGSCVIQSGKYLYAPRWDLHLSWIVRYTNQMVSRWIRMGSRLQVVPASNNPAGIWMDLDWI